MLRLFFILGISFGSLFLGYAAQRRFFTDGGPDGPGYRRATRLSTRMKLFSVLCISPWPILNAFWKLSITSMELALVPLLGLYSALVGGAAAYGLIRFLKVEPLRAGSVFVCCMLTNVGLMGGLAAYVLFGDSGYLTVQLYNMFLGFFFMAVGFPLSDVVAHPDRERQPFSLAWLTRNKIAFVPLSALALGAAFHALAVPRPLAMNLVAAVCIPLSSAVMGFSIGITLRVSRMACYVRELGMIFGVKFALVPLATLPVAWWLGLGDIYGGVPFKTVVLLSFMPTAFIALAPPSIYGFDLDMANSGWLATTLAMLVVLPALSFLMV
ncbi:MAG: AEC family transporter [Desulfovibrionaceae bacterium]